jgi:tetratricopeptide (TPR) repeat protein
MRLAWLPLVLLLALPASAHAQDAAPADVTLGEAQALFRHAVELGDQDRWAEALELFRRSLALVPRPSTEFNVGFALFRLGHFREAIAIFDSYLAATEGETSELRTEAVTRRGQAIANLAALTLEIDPTDASVRVDGALDPSTGPTRVISLDPGRHLVLASATGYVDAQLEVAVLSAEHRTEHLTLALVDAEPPRPEGHETSLVDDPVFWIVGASIAVAIGVGVGVGVATSGTTAPYAGSTGVVLRMP